MKNAQWWMLGVGALTLGCFVVASSVINAGDGDKVKAGIRKAAGLYASGEKAGAAKAGTAVGKSAESAETVMEMFKLAKKGGLGVGKGVDKNNGIEAKLREIARDAPNAKDMANLELMGYDIAALGDATNAHAPKSDMGKKTKKDWMTWSHDMTEHGLALAAAAKSKAAADVKTAATKLNQTCTACHSIFR